MRMLRPRLFCVLAVLASTLPGCRRFGPDEGTGLPSRNTVFDSTRTRAEVIDSLAAECRPENRPPRFIRPADDSVIILQTGSADGTYHRIGCAIASVIEQETGRSVAVITSGGSRDNVQALIDGRADLVISQGDVAHHAYNGEPPFLPGRSFLRLPLKRAPGQRLRAIMGLHYETVHAIAPRGRFNSVSDIDSASIVVVGGGTSGTIGNAVEVLESVETLRADSLRARRVVASSRSALLGIYDSGVDIVFLTSSIDMEEEESLARMLDPGAEDGLEVLPMSDDLIGRLIGEHRYYRPDTVYNSVRIRALLLTTMTMGDSLANRIVEAVHSDLGTPLQFGRPDPSRIRNAHVSAERDIRDDSTLTRDVSVPIHAGAAAIFCDEDGKACAYTRVFKDMRDWAIGIVLVGSILIAIAFIRPIRRFVLRLAFTIWDWLFPRRGFPRFITDAFGTSGVLSRWRWLLIPVFAFTIVLTGALVVAYIDVTKGLESGYSSPFTNRDFKDSLVWMLVFAASGYENETFPVSLVAQIASAATVLIAVGGVLFLVGVVTSDSFARRMRMDLREDVRRLHSHIIVCGWNSRGPALLKGLCSPAVETRARKIVIAADLVFDPVDRYGLPGRRALFVRGSPMKISCLEEAELARADTVVVLSEGDASAEDRDARTLAVAAQAERYVRRLMAEGKRDRGIHTVAELADPENRDLFEAAFIDQIVCQSAFEEQLLVQSVLNPGLTHFMEEVLNVDEHNEVYEVPAHTGKTSFVGLTFDEALHAGREAGVLLLAINRHNGADATGAVARGSDEAVSGLLTNPASPESRAYCIGRSDSLLFLASDQAVLESLFGEASAWRTALFVN